MLKCVHHVALVLMCVEGRMREREKERQLNKLKGEKRVLIKEINALRIKTQIPQHYDASTNTDVDVDGDDVDGGGGTTTATSTTDATTTTTHPNTAQPPPAPSTSATEEEEEQQQHHPQTSSQSSSSSGAGGTTNVDINLVIQKLANQLVECRERKHSIHQLLTERERENGMRQQQQQQQQEEEKKNNNNNNNDGDDGGGGDDEHHTQQEQQQQQYQNILKLDKDLDIAITQIQSKISSLLKQQSDKYAV